MKINNKSTAIGIVLFFITLSIVVDSCQKDYLVPEPIPVPKVAKQTTTLEARFLKNGPSSVNAAYWRTADFLKVDLTDINTKSIYTEDGLLNMTGTYNGLADFNNGDASDLILKAAYDSNKIYILLEWTDTDIDAERASYLFDGKEDPLKPGSLAEDWTSQRNDDQVAIAFDLDNSISLAGSFTDVGCAASCHNGEMKPQSGKTDIWNWSLALSEPLGYAMDMYTDAANGLSNDLGQPMFMRNSVSSSHRSGPMYEWDGEDQKVTKWDGSVAILDPGFYLLNKTAFTGNPAAGRLPYIEECGETCHGVNGEGYGPDLDGVPFNKPGEFNRKTREHLIDFASSLDHSGQAAFNKLSPEEMENVVAKIRGFTGVPGYYLQMPDGSHADVNTNSNVKVNRISPTGTGYKVLLVRDLKTGNSDDIQFDIENTLEYVFGVALMDADGKNHVGSIKETLTIIPK